MEYGDQRNYGLENRVVGNISFHIGRDLKARQVKFTWASFFGPQKRKTSYPHTDHWHIIDAGARALEQGTCLKFVEHTGQYDYIGNACCLINLRIITESRLTSFRAVVQAN